MADGYGSAPKATGKGVKPVPYEPKPGPWGIDTSWLDTPQQTPRLDGAATSLPAPPPLADMHGGGGNEVVNMTNMRAMMEACTRQNGHSHITHEQARGPSPGR